MGLDVYLYKYKDFHLVKKMEEDFNKTKDEEWDAMARGRKYELIPKEEIKSYEKSVAMVARRMGLNSDGEGEKECIELPSKKYPEHMFKIGYLRSSYNGGGINNLLRRKGLEDLYWIFEPNDRSEFVPNWKQAKSRIELLIAQYKHMLSTWRGKHDVEFVGFNIFGGKEKAPLSTEEALHRFGTDHLEKQKEKGMGSYGSSDGHFYLDEPIKVKAIMPGIGLFKEPGCYVIYESDKDEWYLQALEITEEMVDWVLKKKDSHKYSLVWSS